MKKTTPIILVLVAILFSSYPSSAEEKNKKCFDDDPAVVKIVGKIYEKTFPGPPNYESIKKGDRAETQSILKLDDPICANISPQEESWGKRKRVIFNVKEVTLVFLQKGVY